jgi:trans-aconitate 2-methyltransferase
MAREPDAESRDRPMAREWDAASYDRVAAPLTAMGDAVLARLELRGEETVLDAGCGSGRVTEQLAARLPRGRVIAVDASRAMVVQARRRLGDRARVEVCDLVELALDEPVDAILSTATFHWIADHDRLFRRLRAALRPGGRLVAQCGGEGNVAAFRRAVDGATARDPYAASFAGWSGPWNFQTAADTEARLAAAGFARARCWTEQVSVVPERPAEYLRTVMLGAHLPRLAPGLREPFVDAVAARLARPLRLDYVRLNIDAAA